MSPKYCENFCKKVQNYVLTLPKSKHTYMRLVYTSAVFMRGLKPFCAEFYFYILAKAKNAEGTKVHIVGYMRVHSCKPGCTSDPI